MFDAKLINYQCISQVLHVVIVFSLIQAMFPPPCNQYVAWGHGDLSLRIGQLDGDKVCARSFLYRRQERVYYFDYS